MIKDLKRNHGYNADPINNMRIITLSGMDESGAKLLCEKLSEDENYQFDDREKTFDYICQNTDNLPFYIQHVFAYFYESNVKDISPEMVDEAINHLLNDPKDEGFFRHYTDRIKTYYDKKISYISLLILDNACKKTDYWDEDDIINMVKTHDAIEGELVKETLDQLWSDHYFVRMTKNNRRLYKFKYSILQNWWKVNRG